jgi:predicted dehydrogenase
VSTDQRVVVPRAGTTGRAAGSDPVRFGVLGASSWVARDSVVPALEASPKATVVRTASLAGGDRYEDVLADPAVEAVYLPLPNSLHLPWTSRAAAAGKHVLCEKPLGCTADEARTMAEACDAAGVLLCEAYMTPYHPRSTAIADVLRAGRLGALRFGHAAFRFPHRQPADHRWQRAMGGGALADVGIYCLSPLLEAAGAAPAGVAAAAVPGGDGVDASFSGWLTFAGGFSATIECSFEAPEHQHLELVGTDASLRVERPFTPGPLDAALELRPVDGPPEVVHTGGGNAYRGMVDHVCAAIRGDTTLRRPPSASVASLEVMDRLRVAAA